MASSQMLRTEKVVTAAGGRSAYRAEGTIPYRGSGKSRCRGTGKGLYHAACRRPYRPQEIPPARSPCSAAKGQATRPSGSVAEGTLSIILGNGKPKSGSMLDYLGKYPNY